MIPSSISGWIGYAIIAAVIISCIFIAKLQIDFVIKAMKPMLMMMVFLFVINVLVIKTGEPLITIGKFTVYLDAITQTAYIVVRLILMIMITTLLTATTKPMDMTLGIEDLLMPLEKLKVPTHDIAMMISLALRFIPTLIDEADRILKAQASRGVDFENGKFGEKITAIVSLIVPVYHI